MSYKALYRTYRPQIFNDVTGQEVVVQTLQNAIKNNKISISKLKKQYIEMVYGLILL